MNKPEKNVHDSPDEKYSNSTLKRIFKEEYAPSDTPTTNEESMGTSPEEICPQLKIDEEKYAVDKPKRIKIRARIIDD